MLYSLLSCCKRWCCDSPSEPDYQNTNLKESFHTQTRPSSTGSTTFGSTQTGQGGVRGQQSLETVTLPVAHLRTDRRFDVFFQEVEGLPCQMVSVIPWQMTSRQMGMVYATLERTDQVAKDQLFYKIPDTGGNVLMSGGTLSLALNREGGRVSGISCIYRLNLTSQSDNPTPLSHTVKKAQVTMFRIQADNCEHMLMLECPLNQEIEDSWQNGESPSGDGWIRLYFSKSKTREF